MGKYLDIANRALRETVDRPANPITTVPTYYEKNELNELSPDRLAARKRRRDELLMMLADNPSVRYVYTVDTGTDPVILAIGIRDFCTFEMTIAADKYDPFAILQLFEGQS